MDTKSVTSFKVGDEVKIYPKDSNFAWYGVILSVSPSGKTAVVNFGFYGTKNVRTRELNWD